MTRPTSADSSNCTTCGCITIRRSVWNTGTRLPGARAYGSHGMCGACYARSRRDNPTTRPIRGRTGPRPNPDEYRPPAREVTPFGNFELHPTHLKTGVVKVAHQSFPTTPEQKHAASITVCARATDAAEARVLLDMLGLVGGAT